MISIGLLISLTILFLLALLFAVFYPGFIDDFIAWGFGIVVGIMWVIYMFQNLISFLANPIYFLIVITIMGFILAFYIIKNQKKKR